MKKVAVLLLTLLLMTVFAACADNTGDNKDSAELTGTLEEIIKEMHQAVPEEISEQAVFTEITPENVAYHLGTDKVEFTEALAAEPMIGVVPHSIVVLRVAEGTDIDATVALIRENADGQKWICVGVPEDKVLVSNVGHTIALVMDENSQDIIKIFDEMETN